MRQRSATSQRLSRLLMVAVVLILAAGLRLYRLDFQSFWNDEGNSARAAERSIPLILEAAEGDIHPPGYYLLLHYWRAAVGESEFALRALSVVCGVLTVALTYTLGKRLFGERVGLLSALLAAVSPLAVYYSQEARMYALLGLCAAASTYLLMAHIRNGKPLNLLGYIAAAAAGMYTQYTFPLVILSHNVVYAGWWIASRDRKDRWRRIGVWAAGQVAVLVLFLPWLSIFWENVTDGPLGADGHSVGSALQGIQHTLAVGITADDTPAWILYSMTALLLMGLWSRRRQFGQTASVAAWLALPLAVIVAAGLYRPEYRKVLLMVLPPFHLLIARGIDNLAALPRRRAVRYLGAGIGCALLAAGIIPSLGNLYSDPAYARDDYRLIVADIDSAAEVGDGIILNAANQWEVFTYYHRQGAPVYPIPRQRPPHPDQVVSELEQIAANHTRLFAVYWGDAQSDPQRLVESWLTTHTYDAGSSWYGQVRVAVYGVAPLPMEPEVPVDIAFGDRIDLQGYTIGQGPFNPGDIVPITFFWSVREPVEERFKVFVHLIDYTGSLAAQTDAEPQAGLNPTDIWPALELQIDRHGVLLPDVPAGDYALVAGLYHLASGDRLMVELPDGSINDHLTLGTISIYQ